MSLEPTLPEIDYEDLSFYESLSTGTYGSVFRANWMSKNRIVAVKKVLLLEKEAVILGSLRHRNIIQFYGVVTKSPNYCIVTEFAERGCLYDYLSNSDNVDLDFGGIVQWAQEIASGVCYLHNEAVVQIIHRDLKSKNVVLTKDLICKLCDFGTSKQISATVEMTLAGTYQWMSPEMIQSKPVSKATDAWSYGVVLWELITRQVPFKGINHFAIMYMVAQQNERLKIPSSCPEQFADLIRNCWQVDPKERPDFIQIRAQLDSMRQNRELCTETEKFLIERQKWVLEIEHQLDVLKRRELSLYEIQQKLTIREREVEQREQAVQELSRKKQRLSHDVNQWTIDDVTYWLQNYDDSSVTETDINALVSVFLGHKINGQRLLLLTDADLQNMGIKQIGYRVQILHEIDTLRHENSRLINFPPLSVLPSSTSPQSYSQSISHRSSSSLSSASTVSSSSLYRDVHLTLMFGFYMRTADTSDAILWKPVVDVDWSNKSSHSIDSSPYDYISDVKFCLMTSPFDVWTEINAPYISTKWQRGLLQFTKIQFVINYVNSVKRPRNTKHQMEIRQENRGRLESKQVQLILQYDPAVDQTSPAILTNNNNNNVVGLISSPYRQNYSVESFAAIPISQSSPQLQGAWFHRYFHDGVHENPVQLDTNRKKSSLWADIAANIRDDRSIEYKQDKNVEDHADLRKLSNRSDTNIPTAAFEKLIRPKSEEPVKVKGNRLRQLSTPPGKVNIENRKRVSFNDDSLERSLSTTQTVLVGSVKEFTKTTDVNGDQDTEADSHQRIFWDITNDDINLMASVSSDTGTETVKTESIDSAAAAQQNNSTRDEDEFDDSVMIRPRSHTDSMVYIRNRKKNANIDIQTHISTGRKAQYWYKGDVPPRFQRQRSSSGYYSQSPVSNTVTSASQTPNYQVSSNVILPKCRRLPINLNNSLTNKVEEGSFRRLSPVSEQKFAELARNSNANFVKTGENDSFTTKSKQITTDLIAQTPSSAVGSTVSVYVYGGNQKWTWKNSEETETDLL